MDNEAAHREALEDMCFQFAYKGMQGGKRILHTGGLSTLESAFAILGWDDPHVVEDQGCEIAGCEAWCSCVGSYPRSQAKATLDPKLIGFGYLCGTHYSIWNGPKRRTDAPDIGRAE